MDIEDDVAAHYDHPGLEALILAGLAALGQDPDNIDPDVLAAADQLHIGGTDATQSLADGAGLHAGMRVLDVGSGIGGPARYLAHHLGVTVQGVDLTPGSVRTAESLTRRSGLDGHVQFSVASALELPFDDGTFDAATMLHVGMNISNKAGAFREIHRVLKPGGIFALYDIMSMSAGSPTFPLPWASTPATSFLEDRAGYLAALNAAGFRLEGERNRHGFAVEFLQRTQDKMSASGAPPLGMHLHMGTDAKMKLGNLAAGVRQGLLAPVELFSRRD
jgi:MPBQ/MSBQ methyltransferase